MSGLNYFYLDGSVNVLFGQLGLDSSPPQSYPARGSAFISGDFGSIRYGRQERGRDTNSDLIVRVNPQFGFFVLDGLLLEMRALFSHTRTDDLSLVRNSNVVDLFNERIRISNTGLAFGSRYYPLTGRRLQPFVAAELGYQRFTSTRLNAMSPDVTITVTTADVRGGAGIAFFPSPDISFDLLANYGRQRERFGDDVDMVSGLDELELRSNQWRVEASVRVYIFE